MKKVTMPIIIYVIFVLVATICIISYLLMKNCCGEIILGIGTGLLTSLIVAFVTDLVHTKIQQDIEKTVFNMLKRDFDTSCEELAYEFLIAVQEVYGIDDKKRTFIEWSEMLLGDNGAEQKILDEADYALQQNVEIEKHASRLIRESKFYLDNRFIDNYFLDRVKNIRRQSQRIMREHKRRDYQMCQKIISENLVEAIVAYNPQLKEYLKKAYNWETSDREI